MTETRMDELEYRIAACEPTEVCATRLALPRPHSKYFRSFQLIDLEILEPQNLAFTL